MIPFRPHRFARSRRFPPPIALLAQSFAPLLAQDSRACCIPLPILGFAAFRSSFGWFLLPTLAISGRSAAGHANDAYPQRGSYPLEDSPHPQPHRVSTTVASVVFASLVASIDSSSPLPASTFVSGLHEASPSRRCSADGSVPAPAVSSMRPAYPPWALVPFKVLRPRDFSRGGCVAHSVRQHPSERNPCSFAAALVAPLGRNRKVKELRSVPPACVHTRGQPCGWGTTRRPWWRGVRRDVRREARVVTVEETGTSDSCAFRRLCSDPARIRQLRFAEKLRGCRLDRPPCGGWTLRWPRSTFNRGWVTRVNGMVKRSDLIPLELAFELRFSRGPTMVGHRCR